jgi:hypothetical protein
MRHDGGGVSRRLDTQVRLVDAVFPWDGSRVIRPACKRTLAATAVIVLLLAQLGSLLHHAAVRHVRCDHGELVEAPSLAKHSLEDSQLVAVEDGDATGADEHCAFASALGTAPRLAPPNVTTAIAPFVVDAVFTLDRLVTPVALYRTAPKTSPPA